jgi:hypothetical protein
MQNWPPETTRYGSWWSRGSECEEETDGYPVPGVFARLRSPLSQYHPVLTSLWRNVVDLNSVTHRTKKDTQFVYHPLMNLYHSESTDLVCMSVDSTTAEEVNGIGFAEWLLNFWMFVFQTSQFLIIYLDRTCWSGGFSIITNRESPGRGVVHR